MSYYRGFEIATLNRLNRAGSFWGVEDTLKYFNAFGGRCYSIGPNVTILVNSVRNSWSKREYRAEMFVFYADGSRESVQVYRLVDTVATAATVDRRLSVEIPKLKTHVETWQGRLPSFDEMEELLAVVRKD